MKKIFILMVALTGSYTFIADGLVAQATVTTIQQTTHSPVALDEKTQKKVEKAREDLEKDKKTLAKAEAIYRRGIKDYNKKNKKGKLSPDDQMKEQKATEKAEKEIEKLKKNIADNKAVLEKYKM